MTQNESIDGVGSKWELARDTYRMSQRHITRYVAHEPKYTLCLHHLAEICVRMGPGHQHLISKNLFEHMAKQVALLFAQSLAHR